MKRWFAYDQIEQRRAIGLYTKEKDLFCRNSEQCRADNGICGICPYLLMNQVRVPWRGCDYCDLRELIIQSDLISQGPHTNIKKRSLYTSRAVASGR